MPQEIVSMLKNNVMIQLKKWKKGQGFPLKQEHNGLCYNCHEVVSQNKLIQKKNIHFLCCVCHLAQRRLFFHFIMNHSAWLDQNELWARRLLGCFCLFIFLVFLLFFSFLFGVAIFLFVCWGWRVCALYSIESIKHNTETIQIRKSPSSWPGINV